MPGRDAPTGEVTQITNLPKNFLGYAVAQKASDVSEVVVPFTSYDPRNPANNLYNSGINKAAWMANFVRGRNTPGFSGSTYLHAGWVTPAILQSYIASFDGNNDSNGYNWKFNDGGGLVTVHDGARCAALTIGGMTTGPQSLDMAWLSQSAAGVSSFASTGATITGQCYDAAKLDFNGFADLVYGYKINVFRGQAYSMPFVPGSYDPSGVDSGMLGGTLELLQSPKFTIRPGSVFNVRYYATAANAAAGTSPILTVSTKINLDEVIYRQAAGMGLQRVLYTLGDFTAGTAPVAFS